MQLSEELSLVCELINKRKEEQDMAMPIKETPILFGEDARKFEERMKHPRKETPEDRKKRLEIYEKIMKRSLPKIMAT